jgi:hypothetical protein
MYFIIRWIFNILIALALGILFRNIERETKATPWKANHTFTVKVVGEDV